MAVYLQSLEISGFKSFGKRTYLEFSEGITGIVGPNGCGKSNVVESMKWVLGEQSAKSLRGEKMQDIIFAGTKHRSASGMADVVLTFNNELKWLPLEFPEISIGRRVFRSGEGQYFVNGVRSRLKDTTELFLDTGVGRDSYAIFEQGKIDRLLSESAEDRRILFEDFAGISKFKFRKEEAEKKLAQARDNLERLQETIDRLEKEISVLEVQAQDAQHYNTLNNELRQLEVKFEVSRIENMKREILRREQEIAKIQETLSPLTNQLNDIERQIGLNDESLGDKEILFGQMNEKHIRLEKELTESRTRYEMAKKNLGDTKTRLQELELRAKQDTDRLEEWEDTLDEKRDALLDADKKQTHAQQILDSVEIKQEKLKQETNQLEEELYHLSKNLGFTKSINRDDIDLLRKHVAELKGQIFVQESEIIRLEEEIKSKKNIIEEEEQEIHKHETEIARQEDEKKVIVTQKISFVDRLKEEEHHIAYLERELNNFFAQSKACDEKILKAMDQQIDDLKKFQEGVPIRKNRLNSIIQELESLVLNKKPLDYVSLTELKNCLEINEQCYHELLDNMFGENGAFSEKIAYAEKIDQISTEINAKRLIVSDLRAEIDLCTEQESIIFQKISEIKSILKTSEREYQKALKIVQNSEEQQTKINTTFEHIKKEIATTTDRLEKSEQTILEYDQKHGSLRHEYTSIQEELTNARINYHSAETQSRALKMDIKSLEERLSDLQRQIQNVESDKNTMIKSINIIEEEIEDLEIEQDELNPELTRLQEQMKKNAEEITDLRHAKKILEQMHKDFVEQYTKLTVRRDDITKSIDERKENLATVTISVFEQFKIKEGDIVLEKNENTEFLNIKIREFRERLNQLGNVNLLAIEQFQNTKETLSHLIFQKEDIESAASDIEILINDTNKESAERFLEAFEQIRKSFKRLFSELFDGGRADLILKDKTDPLRSGIDIMAEPPGQKFQNVSLLSGGQRAMVAIAVIFSILELKPTPFVILDEMDAPLDDENIDRFKRMLVRFRGTSQFVVVSHSKSTLEVCDVLFGVTMEEQGCSKIVSVAFDETENLLFAQ
ncbi:MAG: chromosome segregation SMC family protein [Brevinema sp.]